MVKVIISPTVEDIANFTYANWTAPFNKGVRFKFVFNTLVLTICGCLAFAGFITLTGARQINWFIVVPLISIFLTSYYWFTIKNRLRVAATRMYSLRENHNMLLQTEITFTKEGIEISNYLEASKLKWAVIVKAIENDSYYFLYINSQFAYIIPKNKIPFDQADSFNRLLSENIPAQYYFTQKT
jgi:hypothetical protein